MPGQRAVRAMPQPTHVEDGEFGQDSTEFLIKAVLAKFDLAHVEAPNAADFEIFVNLL